MINTIAVTLSIVAVAGGVLIGVAVWASRRPSRTTHEQLAIDVIALSQDDLAVAGGVLIGVAVWASRRPRTAHEHLAINVIALSQDDLLTSCPHCNEIFDGPDFIHVSAAVMGHIIANHQGANHD